MPLPERATVTPVARLSPTGKLSVDVVGLLVGLGVSETNPGLVWSVTVRLPVTATALEGTPPCPPTANVRAVPEAKAPERPVPLRVSSRRAGLSETYVAPEVVVGLTVAASCGRTAAAT